MKIRKLGEILAGLVPVIAIAGMGFYFWQQDQAKKALARPDYENPTARYESPIVTDLKDSKEVQVAAVLDGDTIKLENGESVRLCGIDAPEKAQPLGTESKANLEKLIDAAGRTVIVQQRDRDRYGRIVGEVFAPVPGSAEEKYLNAEQILSGNAYLYKQYSGNCMNEVVLEQSEKKAKAENQGVWKAGVQKPWEFRKAQREK